MQFIKEKLVWRIVIACIAMSWSAYANAQITGTVRDAITLSPIEDALVTLQATKTNTLTNSNGEYSLPVGSGKGLAVVGARKGYFNQAVFAEAPASGVDILMETVPQDDDPGYALRPPNNCGGCHPNQYNEWLNTPMADAGLNTWVHDIYNGTGTPGGMGGFVYTRDSMFAGANPNSECASCHQPEAWIDSPFIRMEGPDDIGYPSTATVHGISCETCHKVANVDISKINFPGIFAGAVTFTRPQSPIIDQVMYGVLGDTDYNAPTIMRTSYNPQMVAETCAACHQDAADPDENHSYSGVISEPTYLEWKNSPYGDPQAAQYATCVDCHMPPSGEIDVCAVLFPPLARDPNRIRSHTIQGTTPAFLENSVDLAMQVNRVGNLVEVNVDLTNSMVGHHVPTGVTVRNMILLVEAWREEDGLAFSDNGTQVIHDLGGIGDPAQGYYAGLPGKFFAKHNQDINSNGPTFFTDAASIRFDNRIPALATDSTTYGFEIPGGGGTAHVRARLIYRRAFRFLVDAKQWTEDGHGNPLEDVAPPHYGHLMEISEETLGFALHDNDGDSDVDLIDYAGFKDCFTGPDMGPVAPGCSISDSDNDDDVDLEDYSRMQTAFAG
ncbi:MAG TPA: multiheme c-type cytochrome [Phycisphaerae bacterium]|nr:multiheme c-type cytochrome [Phycisphaerae bacterium]